VWCAHKVRTRTGDSRTERETSGKVITLKNIQYEVIRVPVVLLELSRAGRSP